MRWRHGSGRPGRANLLDELADRLDDVVEFTAADALRGLDAQTRVA